MMIKKISRSKFLKWGVIGGIGAIAAVILGKLFSNSRSVVPESNTTPITEAIPPTPTEGEYNFEVVRINNVGEIISTEAKSAKYQTLDLGDGVTIDFVAIPGGNFIMGSPPTESKRDIDEGPQREISISEFWMSKYPITQSQYQVIMGENPAYFSGKQLPVETISWNDAVKFCELVSEKIGKTIKLPSEAQWEYACRAGTTDAFYFGPTLTANFANYNGRYIYANEPETDFRNTTTEVGILPPNAFGLYDLHGNVWEWCEDDYYSDLSKVPSDGSAWLNSSSDTSSRKVRRGGSWNGEPDVCRSANRIANLAENAYNFIGFRVVMV